ncbi:LacI family DNA-binding transcriptional regulator [Streptomyces sp. yr375]|uniref:LacI family DNA-binding transcriptional regulator n=1 Tax=Streptomyces sp. yr375 TaxID=1761906 RepID=UPI000B8A48AE|nr:LacI family DNA-binding transcriptional regulator [Streptomyces sp. yr375]
MAAVGRRVTLNDVAAASGVSRATVSFVLNDDPRQTISTATRERVLTAARTLGYVPHGIARALREGSSRIVVLDIGPGRTDGSFARSYVRGLDAELAAHDHLLLVRPATPRSDRQALDAIAPRAVLRLDEAAACGGDGDGDGSGDGSGVGESGCAAHADPVRTQLRHLADRGHRHIALALPAHDLPPAEARLRVAREAARQLGLAPLISFVVPRPRAAGTDAVRALRAGHPEVTAVAAFDDPVALRTLTAVHDLGLTAPADLAVIGYDDTGYGELVAPALTTVHLDAEPCGRRAARTALGLDAVGPATASGRVVVRESA